MSVLCPVAQADATLEMEQRDFIRAGLEYVCLIQEVQERKKFEFVETVRRGEEEIIARPTLVPPETKFWVALQRVPFSSLTILTPAVALGQTGH